MTVHAGSATTAVRPPRAAIFRPDIEGLRAVAIIVVLAYHAGLPGLRGGFVGVDVFFVLSGYLITSLLLREIDLTGRVSLRKFYLRRARRLLPATAVVLAFSAVVVVVWTPVAQGAVLGLDITAATLYVVNWRLADRSVDYLAEGVGASPVQHFWSLAVEEQFYIVWPVVILLAVVLLRLRDAGPGAPLSTSSSRAVRRLLGTVLVCAGSASLLWCVAMASRGDPSAYFVTTTRLWELAIGALVAVLATRCPPLSTRTAAALGGAGLLAICASAVLLSADTAWPGPATLAPTLGAAAVIVSGLRGTVHGSSRVLSARALVWVGGLSYSIYLWHWPLLVAAEGALGGALSPRAGLVVVIVSVLPAWLTHRLVENPVRFSQRFADDRAALRVAALCITVGVLAGVLATSPWVRTIEPPPPGSRALGAEVLQSDPAANAELWRIDTFDWVTPLPSAAPADVPVSYADGCQADALAEDVAVCEYGDRTSETVVALVGDSKALQWQPALAQLALEGSWRLVTMTKSGCAFSGGVQPFNDAEPYLSCVRWNVAVSRSLQDLGPDVVITSQYASTAYETETSLLGSDTTARMRDDLALLWDDLTARDVRVVALLDTPTPPFEVYECVAEHPEALSECAFDATSPDRENASVVQRAAASRVPGVEVVDMTPYVCPGSRCPAVMGNVLTYRQGSHLTKTFVESLTSALHDALGPLGSVDAVG